MNEQRLLSLRYLGALAVSIILSASVSVADELVYRPVNPAFGGNPLNGNYLLHNSTAQRKFSAPKNRTPAIEEFAEDLQRTLLRRVAREIADAILGEEAADSGTFTIGETRIDFNRVNDEVQIRIDDPAADGTTTITLPVPQLSDLQQLQDMP